MKTYLSKFNKYGNRLQLTVNEANQTMVLYGCHFGNYGEVQDNMLQRDIKAIYNELIQGNYSDLSLEDFRRRLAL